jgi:anaerobic ribonucleoside-triphosphate reductase activating protein
MNCDETFLLAGERVPSCHSNAIQVAMFQERTWLAGPGARAVVWVAGCLRRCPGCMNEQYRSFRVGQLLSVDSLAERILAVPDLQGVTYSGGEPFEQGEPLACLSQRLRKTGLSVASYTGYSYETLHNALDRFGSLLREIDVLIDGEYRNDVPPQSPWVGSGNQRIHVFTDTGTSEDWLSPQVSSHIEISLRDKNISLAGVSLDTQHLLIERLESRGIIFDSVLK